ncbi:alpha-2-macroglobulin family protein [Devosia sp.]|uniref:alpha-2-macroglobulin family protein n=1 Tax=Devosia sp. TaxID=1871048 RepID=UPI003A8E421A
MRPLLGAARRLGLVLMLGLGLASPLAAADRVADRLPATDLPGGDYQILRNQSLDACEASCVDDRVCRAYTFNEQAGWCFLKGEAGEPVPFAGATSGRIKLTPTADALAATRQSELPFPADWIVSGARELADQMPATDPAPPEVTYADLVAAGDEAAAADNPAAATVSYRQALGIVGNDPALWQKLAEQSIQLSAVETERGGSTYALGSLTTSAAINAFLRAESRSEQAAALGALGQGLGLRDMWREAIATYRASLALVDDAQLQAQLDAAVAEHGFRVTSHEVESETATPRICAVFSETLPGGETDLSAYVSVADAPRVAVEAEQSQLCVSGVEFGKRYEIRLRAGLPAASGEELRDDVQLSVFVPDRSPFVGFANAAYVMPAGLGGGLPITSINADLADVVIYRIGDRSVAAAVRDGIFQGDLTGSSAEDVADRYGEKTWEGEVELARAERNAMQTTAIPVNEILTALEPGAYVVTARVSGAQENYWAEMATQWFIVTDLGLTAISGTDGVHTFVRSLTSAEPVAGATVRLIAVNNEVLGETVTDVKGQAVFAPGLARGEGGRAPQLVVAETEAGDYAFLDATRPAFDLTDRGVDGRPSPGPLDLFATTERGVYRPGETVFVTALMRDAQANAVTDLPLTVEFQRPDGVVSGKELLQSEGAGGYFTGFELPEEAMRGSWQGRFYADPEAPPLNTVTFLVEDFEPERLAFEVTADPGAIAADTPASVDVSAKYLYGAVAPGLDIEADFIARPVTSLAQWPGYVFGRTDDTVETYREPLGIIGTTDDAGDAVLDVTVPELTPTTRLYQAQLLVRLIDSNGRTVERSLSRPILADGTRLGIKPQFDSDGDLAKGDTASFDIVAVAPDGDAVAADGLAWTLSRIETNYQWYRDGGAWKWEAVTTNRVVADGEIDVMADAPASVSAPISWGRYLFEVEGAGTSSSYEFYGGYYYADAGSDTPDTLQVALDKPAYRAGETAQLKLEPQFAGQALVMVLDDRIIDMVAVDVPEEGTTVSLPVTEAWGPGAYVTAVLYRPADAAQKRMPARALGLDFANVEPGDRLLATTLDVASEAKPRTPLEVTVELGNVAAGETAYVAVAAVDLGILNLTNFKTPDPDGWYFGQRQLGMEIRDLYGQLIDPMQGLPGAVRSGGDGEFARTGTPPAVSVLVAMHSGIVEVDADGKATVRFDIPDFNGTVRIMAMAWTASALGHAEADVVIHDDVVVNLSPPRFLRTDDTSRLLVEIDNLAGPAGTYDVELLTGEGIDSAAGRQSVTLEAEARTTLSLDLTGTRIGDHELRLLVTDPSGDALVKDLTLGVRPVSSETSRTRSTVLEPGETLDLKSELFAGIVPQTGALRIAVGPISRLNVPELLFDLDRYPYGCAEQVSSRALPLIYLNEVAAMLGMGSDTALKQRVVDAIADIRSKQNSSGSFGVWGPFSYTNPWLDAYVTEFLLRARDAGYDVPDLVLSQALDNLANRVAYASDFEQGGEEIAYALYVLARAGRAAIGDLRYYFEARLDAFGSPLAKAQLGAALALYGDRARAATAFAAAVADLDQPEPSKWVYRADYGSRLRDTAGVLALAAEADPGGIDLAALTADLAERRNAARYTSTQEDAWTLVAAAALTRNSADGSLSIDGEALTGSAYRYYDEAQVAAGPITLANDGTQPIEIGVTITGYPAKSPPASESGFTISRSYFNLDGTEADLDSIAQNDRFVAVIDVTSDELGSGSYLVADPLPAGFEIENPDLSAGNGAADFSWLKLTNPAHTEARTDRYVAAFRFWSETDSFTIAYIVRAVSPGTFTLPGALVEDMYRPERRANTAAGAIEITPTGP